MANGPVVVGSGNNYGWAGSTSTDSQMGSTYTFPTLTSGQPYLITALYIAAAGYNGRPGNLEPIIWNSSNTIVAKGPNVAPVEFTGNPLTTKFPYNGGAVTAVTTNGNVITGGTTYYIGMWRRNNSTSYTTGWSYNATLSGYTLYYDNTGTSGIAALTHSSSQATSCMDFEFYYIAKPAVMAKPTIVSVGDSSVKISWVAPSLSGGTIKGYYVSVNGGAAQSMGTTTSHTFTGLTNGVSYTFKVLAVNELSVLSTSYWPAYSPSSNSATPLAATSTPTGTVAYSSFSTAVVNLSSLGTAYSYSVTAQPTNGQVFQTISTPSATPQVTLTGFNPNFNDISYDIWVYGYNNVGTLTGSSMIPSAPLSSYYGPAGPPAAPNGLIPVNSSSITPANISYFTNEVTTSTNISKVGGTYTSSSGQINRYPIGVFTDDGVSSQVQDNMVFGHLISFDGGKGYESPENWNYPIPISSITVSSGGPSLVQVDFFVSGNYTSNSAIGISGFCQSDTNDLSVLNVTYPGISASSYFDRGVTIFRTIFNATASAIAYGGYNNFTSYIVLNAASTQNIKIGGILPGLESYSGGSSYYYATHKAVNFGGTSPVATSISSIVATPPGLASVWNNSLQKFTAVVPQVYSASSNSWTTTLIKDPNNAYQPMNFSMSTLQAVAIVALATKSSIGGGLRPSIGLKGSTGTIYTIKPAGNLMYTKILSVPPVIDGGKANDVINYRIMYTGDSTSTYALDDFEVSNTIIDGGGANSWALPDNFVYGGGYYGKDGYGA